MTFLILIVLASVAYQWCGSWTLVRAFDFARHRYSMGQGVWLFKGGRAIRATKAMLVCVLWPVVLVLALWFWVCLWILDDRDVPG